eukprot:513796-Rhodomonas_salina.1
MPRPEVAGDLFKLTAGPALQRPVVEGCFGLGRVRGLRGVASACARDNSGEESGLDISQRRGGWKSSARQEPTPDRLKVRQDLTSTREPGIWYLIWHCWYLGGFALRTFCYELKFECDRVLLRC